MLHPEFNALTLQQKAPILWAKGVFVDTISYYGYNVNLYALYDFFVEVYYSPVENQIEKIEGVDLAGLAKFVNRINLDDLK